MARPAPRLSVRLKTTRTDTDITNQLSVPPTYRIAIPGGFASATLTLNRPLGLTRDDIELYAKIFIYDGRSGDTLWEGQLEDPGRSSDNGGAFEVTAIGPSAHTRDVTAAYLLVDGSLEHWHRSIYANKNSVTTMDEIDQDTPALAIQAPSGTAIPVSWAGDWIYRPMLYSGQVIARVRADYICGGNSTLFNASLFGRVGAATATYSTVSGFSTTASFIGANTASSGWDPAINVVSLRAQRDTSSTTADDNAWIKFYNVVVRALLKNADGSDITAGTSYNVNNVDPVEVVADLLGRFLPLYDGANAVLIGSGVDLTQLAYPDGITPAEVLDDLMVYDPGFYWAAYESNTAGLYRFVYQPWPTTVRYEANITDGFDSPGSAADLYNSVLVRWRAASGEVRNLIRTSTVSQLTHTRRAYIDLSDETGSLSNATRVGDNFLAEHKYPPNAGTLIIGRPILDNDTGRMVMPWEIKPGYLIRVQGVNPRVDALNPMARDGVTIFKVVSAEYNGGDGTASLELDSQSRTIANALRNLHARRLKRR